MQGGQAGASLASSKAGIIRACHVGNKRPASVAAPGGTRMPSHRLAGSHAGSP